MKLLSLAVMISILVCFSLPANAVQSTMYVSAGSTAYTNNTSTATINRYNCNISLEFVQFSYYPQNSIPSSYYVYARLCTSTGLVNATYAADFSSLTTKSPSFWTGHGAKGTTYVLKTYSDLDIYYSARFDWTANGQAA